MNKNLFFVFAALMLGCANEAKENDIVARNDAVEDFIVVAELEDAGVIRTTNQLRHKPITDRYIILEDRRSTHLLVFTRRCRELEQSGPAGVTPDIRYDTNRLRSRTDTYRGCRIEALYEVTEGQAQELLDLAD